MGLGRVGGLGPVADAHRQRMWRRLGLVGLGMALAVPPHPQPFSPAEPGEKGAGADGVRRVGGLGPVAEVHRQRMCRPLGLVGLGMAFAVPPHPQPSPPPSRGRRGLEQVGLGRVEGLGPVADAHRQRMCRPLGW